MLSAVVGAMMSAVAATSEERGREERYLVLTDRTVRRVTRTFGERIVG